MPRPRVLIGDSSRAMLAFLEILLESQFEVVAFETEGEALVLTAKNLLPDLVILDFSLSFLEGLSLGRQLHETVPNAKVVFFSSHEDPAYAAAAFEVGAMGYLVKQRTVDLGHYLGRVLRGERVCCPDHIQKKAEARRHKDHWVSSEGTPSGNRRPTMVRVIPMCGLCRRVREEGFPSRGTTGWVDFPSYLAQHVVPLSQIQFSSDYCSECRLSYDILKSYGT